MQPRGLLKLWSFESFGRRRSLNDKQSQAVRPQPHKALSYVMLEEFVAEAEATLAKWDPDASNYAKITSLFRDDRTEARDFLTAVHRLQRAMISFVSAGDLAAAEVESKDVLVRAQTLMQAAMRRLEKELHQILAANRDLLDPESVSTRSSTQSSISDAADEDDVRTAGACIGKVECVAAAGMDDLRAIVEAMMSAGYGMECIKVYRVLRKSIIDEGLYRLGFERLTPSKVHKMDWPLLETKIQSWLASCGVAITTLFSGERILLDHVFSGFNSIREAIYADIAEDAAVQFLRFPELVADSKRTIGKLFRILDIHNAVSELLPEIELVFSFSSTTSVRDQALASLSKLAQVARALLADLETRIYKEKSKSLPPGGEIHPLTRHAMDRVANLADYESTLSAIFAGFPLQNPNLHPDFCFDASHFSPVVEEGQMAMRLANLVLVLVCKLDSKAAAYRNPSLSYLFLANNLQYIVNKVRSCRLRRILGEEWAMRYAAKARQHVAGYERLSWGKVAAIVPAKEVTLEEARERMREFPAAIDEVCTTQAGWVVADSGMREEVRSSVLGMVLPAYRGFYQRWRAILESENTAIAPPEYLRDRLTELFSGAGETSLVQSQTFARMNTLARSTLLL